MLLHTKRFLVYYFTWKKQDVKRAYWRLRNSMSYSCGVKPRSWKETEKTVENVFEGGNNSYSTTTSSMNMVALYGITLVETVTTGKSLSRGKRAGLIQSERTPTKNGEKASPSAWLTRICGNFVVYQRLNEGCIKYLFEVIIKWRNIY